MNRVPTISESATLTVVFVRYGYVETENELGTILVEKNAPVGLLE